MYCDIKIDLEIILKSSHDMPYAGNEERQKYSSNPFPTRYEREVGGRLQPLYPRERNSTLCIGGWVVLVACLDGTENLPCTGIRSSDRPAPSESLYPPLSRSTLQIFLARKATALTTHTYGCYSQPFISRSSIRMSAGIA